MGTYLYPVGSDETLEVLAGVRPGTAARFKEIQEAILLSEFLPLQSEITQLGHQFGTTFASARTELEDVRDTDPELSRFYDFALAGFGKLTAAAWRCIESLGLESSVAGEVHDPDQIARLLDCQGVNLPLEVLSQLSGLSWK